MGAMKISAGGKVTYTSGNSWNTILDEIADIKNAMNPIYSSYSVENCTTSPRQPSSFPFFGVSAPSILELLPLLPARGDVEMFTYKFFKMLLPMCPCIHKPSFLKSLSDFYVVPEAVDPTFLGTLFSVLACGISLCAEDIDTIGNILPQKGASSGKEMANIWCDAAKQAFCLGAFLSNTTIENIQVPLRSISLIPGPRYPARLHHPFRDVL
jgi:hypothetical protein